MALDQVPDHGAGNGSPAPAPRAVRPVELIPGPVDASVQVPGSKSVTNRALVCAALAHGDSHLVDALAADDTEAMVESLRRLGVQVTWSGDGLVVAGTGGELPATADSGGPVRLDARLSGTTARFLLPLLALGRSPVYLDGADELRARPMADGIAAVRALGHQVVDEGRPGHLPVTVTGQGDAPSAVSVHGSASSQFLSGLLLAAPAFPGGLRLLVDSELVSRPYVDMTVAVMSAFGADVSHQGGSWTVAAGTYGGRRYQVEPDASAASYFFAAAAILGGRVTVTGLGTSSLQGDLGFVRVLEQMGCQVEIEAGATTVTAQGPLHGVEVHLSDLSDTAQTLAAVAVFANSPTRITGIGFIRHKETDRIGNVVAELRRCGIKAEEEPDGLVVCPGQPQPATIQTYGDHRMAMSFALLGLRAPGIQIADPDCVGKTFPGYWDAIDQLR